MWRRCARTKAEENADGGALGVGDDIDAREAKTANEEHLRQQKQRSQMWRRESFMCPGDPPVV